MSLFADYRKEREGVDVIETPQGFITFRISGPECYIIDVYVVPEFRRKGYSLEMEKRVIEIAKSKECKYLLGSISPATTGSTDSLKALLAAGYLLRKSQDNLIFLTKELH